MDAGKHLNFLNADSRNAGSADKLLLLVAARCLIGALAARTCEKHYKRILAQD
jgi:hypothetical protein